MAPIKNRFKLGSFWKHFQQVLKPILVFFVPSQMPVCGGLVLAVPTNSRYLCQNDAAWNWSNIIQNNEW